MLEFVKKQFIIFLLLATKNSHIPEHHLELSEKEQGICIARINSVQMPFK